MRGGKRGVDLKLVCGGTTRVFSRMRGGAPCLRCPLFRRANVMADTFSAQLKKIDRNCCSSLGLDFSHKSSPTEMLRGFGEVKTSVNIGIRSVILSGRARAAGMHMIATRSGKGNIVQRHGCASISKVVAGIPKVYLIASCTSYMPLCFMSPIGGTVKLDRSN